MSNEHSYPNLQIIEHPFILHKLSLMRRKETPTTLFRQLTKEISQLMGYEVTRHVPITHEKIETPMAAMAAPVLAGRKPAVVAILRAGLGMSEGLHELIPSAREGHIGLYRDPETLQPVEYFVKLPASRGRLFIVCDPMLATGNSAAYAIDLLNRHGVEDQNIRMMVLVASPEGVAVMRDRHPHVRLYAAALDEGLDQEGYILPGLGDAGDRLYGTR